MPTPAIKPRTEPMDAATFKMLTRAIEELLLITIAADNKKATASGSNVVPFERGARR
jgi:hypothetical protein